MVKYIVRRLCFTVFLLVGVSLLVFLISRLVPSDPIATNLGDFAMNDPLAVEAFRARWGLDQPLYMQYLTYLGNLLTGDFGTSIRTGSPVLRDLAQFFPATLELSLFAMSFAILFGVLFGVLSASFKNKPVDYLARTVSISGVSVPNFWFALLMLFLFFSRLGWFPGGGRLGTRTISPTGGTGLFVLDAAAAGNWPMAFEALHHLMLPALVLGFFTMGLISRQTRSNLLETMSQDYIRTARAKGLTEEAIVRKHALGNALIPVITVVGMGFCNLLGGMVFVENIFSWPGIGQYAYLSAITLDFPAITGVSLLIAFVFVLINLIVDILYAAIDPRVRL